MKKYSKPTFVGRGSIVAVTAAPKPPIVLSLGAPE